MPGLPSPLVQQPFGHESRLQKQTPSLQMPGRSIPPQSWQTDPGLPQAKYSVPVWQPRMGWQQPRGQLCAVQRQWPSTHAYPASQERHTPPRPQACGVFPGWQVSSAAQQPFGHAPAVQTQAVAVPGLRQAG